MNLAGRPQGMARKVAELEAEVVAMYRRLDAAIPSIHKQTRKDGSSATESPWVNLHHVNCGLVVAAADLGDVCRKAAGIDGPGPIEAELGGEPLQRIRRQIASRGNGSATTDTHRLRAAIRTVEDRLPGHAGIRDEIEWVASNLHRDDPDVAKAPSIAAANMFLDVRADSAVRRDFWNILWSKRLTPGEKRPKDTPFVEDREGEDAVDNEAHRAELRRRLFGGDPAA